MAISILQKAKNAIVYQVNATNIKFPNVTTAGSYILVVVEGQKSGFPYSYSALAANTLTPTVYDDKSNTYTLAGYVKNAIQEPTSGATQPDLAGFFPSVYVFLAPATAGTQKISVAAFYPAEITSPVQVGGRAVYDGGLQVQMYEIAGLSTGVDSGATGTLTVNSNAATLGGGVTPSGNNELVVEALALIDSSAFKNATTATLQDVGAFLGGASYWGVQTTIQTTAAASSGFSNPLRYAGAVVTVVLK